jgi:hypothetical protein
MSAFDPKRTSADENCPRLINSARSDKSYVTVIKLKVSFDVSTGRNLCPRIKGTAVAIGSLSLLDLS